MSDTGKPVVGINLQTGQRVHFKSSAEAARELGIGDSDKPATVARGITKSTSGWWFRFEDDFNAQPPTIWGAAATKAAIRALQGKKVVAIHLISGEKQIFDTTGDAAKAIGINQSAVSMVARGEIKSARDW